jgi:hypothetical protein
MHVEFYVGHNWQFCIIGGIYMGNLGIARHVFVSWIGLSDSWYINAI